MRTISTGIKYLKTRGVGPTKYLCLPMIAFLAWPCAGATLTNSLITATKSAVCSSIYPPALATTFLPTDTEAVVWFRVTGMAVSDQVKLEYYDPQNILILTSSLSPVPSAGTYCFNSSVSIAGNASAQSLGMYTVKAIWNDNPFFILNFWIQNPGLTMDQKVFDFQAIASLYEKRYALYDWKKQLFQYDALELKPWIDRIMATKDDLDYLDLLVQYGAALNDTHSNYRISSDFVADLNLRVDVYFDDSGKKYSVLIDSINRSVLSTTAYPFQPGDELLTLDGAQAIDLVEQFRKYSSASSYEAAMHYASSYISLRPQNVLARAFQVPPTSTVEIKRRSGSIEKYTIPWYTFGTALTRIGPVAMPRVTRSQADADAPEQAPLYMRTLMRFRNERLENPPEIAGYGALTPIWAAPSTFTQRLGRSSSDSFYTGTFSLPGTTIGFIRIPHFGPTSITAALKQLDTEIAFFEGNTDGLVIDVMRNTGGDPCYGEEVLARLMAGNWRAMGRQIRPVWSDIAEFQYDLWFARLIGETQETINLLQARLNDITMAYQSDRGLTPPVSTCAEGLDRQPALTNYTKPVLLLTDELSTSAADGFSAQFQDNQRGKVFGWRTNGAGGSVLGLPAGFYSEGGAARVVVSMHYRPNLISTTDYPPAHYVENIGVRPNIPFRYVTIDNMRQNGAPFVNAFLDVIVSEIQKSR